MTALIPGAFGPIVPGRSIDMSVQIPPGWTISPLGQVHCDTCSKAAAETPRIVTA